MNDFFWVQVKVILFNIIRLQEETTVQAGQINLSKITQLLSELRWELRLLRI